MGRDTQAESAALERAAASSYWTEAEARGVLEAVSRWCCQWAYAAGGTGLR
jgi:hypothetical protein